MSTWHIYLTAIPQENIAGPLATLSAQQCLASPGPLLQKQLAYMSWLGASGPDCYLAPKVGHLQKAEVTFKS